jgi:methionyl-tRNA formyltransferase
VAVVVSRADKRRSRGGAPEPSPVKRAALELGLSVTDRPDDVLAAGVELGVVVAYGRIIRPPLLGALPLVNVHFSLLPRWRGAAPVERAILAGDTVTGVCVMGVEAGLDTGPVYRCASTPIGAAETAAELRARLAVLGRDLLVEALAEGLGAPEEQRGEPTTAAKITAEELHIDWTQPAEQVVRVIRLGRAWTTWRGKRLLVLAATATAEPVDGAPDQRAGTVPGTPDERAGTVPDAPDERAGTVPDAPDDRTRNESGPGSLHGVDVTTGRGAVHLLSVQPEGRAALDAAAWVRGARPAPGERLGR